eukprot:g6024.t1
MSGRGRGRGKQYRGGRKKRAAVGDHRAKLSDKQIHPGSYARLLPPYEPKWKDAPEGGVEGGGASSASADAPKWPKRKVAFLVGYNGLNYQGLQMNPGIKSVEAELERALFRCGAISRENYGVLQKVGWSRAGRTDK